MRPAPGTLPTWRLPGTELVASRAGLGCNNFGVLLERYPSHGVIGAALDAGVTFFDTADVYGEGDSERFLGHALARRRAEVLIATKFGFDPEGRGGRASAAAVRASLEASLRRLRTETIDLYQLHSPDPVTPLAETLGALTELIAEGKVRAVGCCNFNASQLAEADRVARVNQTARFVTVQVEWNLLSRAVERELIPLARRLGVAVIPHSPLAGGVLTDKYDFERPAPRGTRLGDFPEAVAPWLTPAHLARRTRWKHLAERAGLSLSAYSLGWLSARPEVSVMIPGATRGHQVKANVAAILQPWSAR